MTSTIYCNTPFSAVSAGRPDYIMSASGATNKTYTEGKKLAGTYAAEWKENLPDLTPNAYGYYRKLILV